MIGLFSIWSRNIKSGLSYRAHVLVSSHASYSFPLTHETYLSVFLFFFFPSFSFLFSLFLRSPYPNCTQEKSARNASITCAFALPSATPRASSAGARSCAGPLPPILHHQARPRAALFLSFWLAAVGAEVAPWGQRPSSLR